MYTNISHLSTFNCMDLLVNIWVVEVKYLEMMMKTLNHTVQWNMLYSKTILNSIW